MSISDEDTLILEELKAQNIGGLTDRGKAAIRELAEANEAAIIFLFLSLNSRITELENAISYHKGRSTIH